MNIALVYDRVNKFGGAEQVLLALHSLWPQAPLYTAVYDKEKALWADVFTVHPSFIQSFPFAKDHHELYPWLTPLGFESFSFDQYDVVISITSAEAKNILTKPQTLHICYCLTPTRYLWSGYETYKKEPGLGAFSFISRAIFPKMLSKLRRWDYLAAQRPDCYVAISKRVKKRIKTYYDREVSAVIYPPVNTHIFTLPTKKVDSQAPYLIVSRLVPYKRIDLVIDACNQLKLPLQIIGDGKDKARLMNRAGSTIEFITHKLTESELRHYYQECKAFIFAGEEDFGIVGAEAQSCGKPVLCYEQSGMAEIVVPGKTGELFSEQSVECVSDALSKFDPKQYDPETCRQQAMLFDISSFQQQMKTFVDRTHKEYYAITI